MTVAMKEENLDSGRPACAQVKACKDTGMGRSDLGDSGNGGTTLEFLSPFLWSVPPLEMRQVRQEFFPGQSGKASLTLS